MANPFRPSLRPSVSLAFRDPDDAFVEVTEWTNGEGYDVVVCAKHDLGERRFSLTQTEADALMACVGAARVKGGDARS